MKDFICKHAEKLGLFASIALGAYLVYGSFSISRYQRKPDDFVALTTKADINVTSTPAQLHRIRPLDIAAANAGAATHVAAADYRCSTRWMRPYNFGQSFRTDPKILTPIKPIVQSNRGAIMQYKTDARGKRIVRRVKLAEVGDALVVVPQPNVAAEVRRPRGLNPNNEQRRERELESDQRRIFEIKRKPSAAGPNADAFQPIVGADRTPTRRKVVLAAANRDDAKAAKDRDADKMVEVAVEEVAGKRWVEVASAFPHAEQIRTHVRALREPCDLVGVRYACIDVQRRELQPDYQWSPWSNVSVEEQVNVVQNAKETEDETDGLGEAVLPGLAMRLPKLISAFRESLPSRQFIETHFAQTEAEVYAEEYWEPLQFNQLKPPPRKTIRNKVQPGQAAPVAAVLPPRVMPGMPGMPAAVDPNARPAFDNHFQVKNVLIRFWDFTVLPGKRYQYRIRAKAYNPNRNRKDVAETESAKLEVLTGPWSDASDEVYTEPDANWYAAAKQVVSRNDRVSIEVHFWSKEMGEWVVKEVNQRVGDMIGISGIKGNYDLVRFDNATRQSLREKRTVSDEMNVGAILLDVAGGRVRQSVADTPRIFNMPKEVVAVTENGDLIRRSDNEDANDTVRQAIASSHAVFLQYLEGISSSNAIPNNAVEPANRPIDPAAGPKKGSK